MYWILFIGIAVVSYLVQANLKRKFEKYSEVTVASGMTGAEVAQKMLRDNGIFAADRAVAQYADEIWHVNHK